MKEQIKAVEAETITWHRNNDASRRLETLPGIGPITASALAATITDPSVFKSGRQLAAWIGLIPRESSSGGKERLGHVTKQGEPYMRRLLVIGASAVTRFCKIDGSALGGWITSLRAPSARQAADGTLLARLQDVHGASRDTYGAPRIHAALRAQGERHDRKRIARPMRAAGLVGASHRKGGPTTTRRDAEARPAPDLVDRHFKAQAPDQLRVADIMHVPTISGFLNLAVVLDVCSRKVVI